MMRVLPDNSWEIYLDSVEKARAIMDEILEGKPIGPLLNQFVPILAFQQGICLSRWIVNNPELVQRLNEIQSYTKEEFEEVAELVRESVDRLIMR